MQTRITWGAISRLSNQAETHLVSALSVLALMPALLFAGVPARQSLAGAAIQRDSIISDVNNGRHTANVGGNQTGNENARVHPVNSRPYGMSYAEWTAEWWRWILKIPPSVNPNFDTTGQNCAQGQTGHVWFLAGSFGGPGVVRSCTVPVGTSLLFPVLNGIFGAGLADCLTPVIAPGPCEDYTFGTLKGVPALRAAAAATQDNPVLLRATVDGVPLTNLEAYRFQSPVFSYSMTDVNVLSVLFGVPVPGGTYTPAVSDGYWIMLAPLSAGTHTVQFESVTASGFSTGVITYNLIVAPPLK